MSLPLILTNLPPWPFPFCLFNMGVLCGNILLYQEGPPTFLQVRQGDLPGPVLPLTLPQVAAAAIPSGTALAQCKYMTFTEQCTG